MSFLAWCRMGARQAEHLERIDSFDDWARLSARPGHHTVARTETVKFIIDLHDAKRTYFLDTKKWEVHFNFVRRFIDPLVDFERFSVQEYTRDDRRFMLGSIMHYLDGEHWSVELAGGDSLGAEGIVAMFDRIVEQVRLPVSLQFRPVSPGQIDSAATIAYRIPVLSSESINASVEYQPVVLGVAYGHLRLRRGKLDVSSVRPYDIVVTDIVPEEIPPVAGLVTSQIQAPLAHVAVLSRNRNTPDMALRGAIELEAFQRLDGQVVKLTVGGQEFGLELAQSEEAEKAWAAMRPAAPFTPQFDPLTTGLVDVAQRPACAALSVGAKAAQVGLLGGIDGIRTPPSFALPFSTYVEHLKAAGLDREIEAMLADPEFARHAGVRAQRLARLREAICAQPVAPDVLNALVERLRSIADSGRAILRSSTNAEDLEGFNGAGLYESIALPADPTPDQVADALRGVWASVWLQRAYEERDWYRIEHRSVAMAVLVQRFVDDVVATGVAITGNPFKQGQRAVFINTQVSGATVTGALGNQLPEQFLVANWYGSFEPALLSRSSLTGGAAILHAPDLQALTGRLLQIHESMLPAHGGSANAMDVEFALTVQRDFVFLQARPYTIIYSLDRSRAPSRGVSWPERVARRVRRILYRATRLGAPRKRMAEPAPHALETSRQR
jgi:rifampicin phosphotransferase